MRVIVIGGGAAGLLAAATAAKAGHSVLLLEKNEKTGKKLYITGKGRCNLTNDCDRDGFFAHVVRNPKFLYSAYAACTPQDMMALIEGLGIPLKVERGGRVFPASDKSSASTCADTSCACAAVSSASLSFASIIASLSEYSP